jgi:hypothetical protein
MAAQLVVTGQSFQSDIPARMDRLPWSRWHWLVPINIGWRLGFGTIAQTMLRKYP